MFHSHVEDLTIISDPQVSPLFSSPEHVSVSTGKTEIALHGVSQLEGLSRLGCFHEYGPRVTSFSMDRYIFGVPRVPFGQHEGLRPPDLFQY